MHCLVYAKIKEYGVVFYFLRENKLNMYAGNKFMDLKFNTEKYQDNLLVHLEGELNTESYHPFERKLIPMLTPSVKLLIFDLKKLTYISSVGIRVLLIAKKIVEKNGGAYFIVNVQTNIQKVFDIVNFIPQENIITDLKELDCHIDTILKHLQKKNLKALIPPEETYIIDLSKKKAPKPDKENCPICKTLHFTDKNDNKKLQTSPLTTPAPVLLHETNRFAIICDPHPVVLGHVLVTPRPHFLSYASIPAINSPHFAKSLSHIKEIIGAKDYFEFEHGAGMHDGIPTSCGNSVFHAHWHILPIKEVGSHTLHAAAAYVLKITKGLVPYPINFKNDDNIIPKLHNITNGLPYLLMKQGKSGFVFIEEGEIKVPSQILRKVSAKFLCGDEAFWDWKNMSQEDKKLASERVMELIHSILYR